MNRLTRNDYKAHSRMNKVCSSKRAKSICGTHRGHDSQRKLTNRRNSVQHKTTQKKRRSKSALPSQSQRRSMPQKHGQVGQRKSRTTGHHNGSRAEKINDYAFELNMYLDDHYNYMQHIKRHDAEIPKEPSSKRQNTKDVFSLRKRRESRHADDVHCHPAKQQTTDDQTVKYIQHDNNDNTDVCLKSQANGIEQISEKLVRDNTKNKLTDKKKIKKGFFASAYRTFLACFGIRNDRK